MENSRETPIKTKKGIIFYSKDYNDWKIKYPDGGERYGGAKISNSIITTGDKTYLNIS